MSNELLPPEAYYSVFQDNEVGRKIFEELTSVFYDQTAFDPDNTHRTAFMAGQRDVMKHILVKIMQAEAGEQEPDQYPE